MSLKYISYGSEIAPIAKAVEAANNPSIVRSYNVAAFNPSAEEIRDVVLEAFPSARIDWDVDQKRQGILDSWPADVDDSTARRDWGFAPRYDFEHALKEYLVPTIRQRYARR